MPRKMTNAEIEAVAMEIATAIRAGESGPVGSDGKVAILFLSEARSDQIMCGQHENEFDES